MNAWINLESIWSGKILEVLGHFIWQGALIGLAALMCSFLLRRSRPEWRYAMYVCALGCMALCIPATIYFLHEPQALDIPRETAFTTVSTPVNNSVNYLPIATVPPSILEMPASEISNEAVSASTQAQKYLWIAWHCGVLLLVLRFIVSLGLTSVLGLRAKRVEESAILEALERQSAALGLNRSPKMAWCPKVTIPMVVGVLRPVILLPLSFTSGLNTQQVEMVLCHELAHIRRLDPIINVAQRLLEAMLFYHPAVWFISRRIRLERELCCDDAVVRIHGESHAYAESLVRLALVSSHPTRFATALGAVDGKSDFSYRVLRLLEGSSIRSNYSKGSVSMILIMAAVLITGAAVHGQATSNTPEPLVGDVLPVQNESLLPLPLDNKAFYPLIVEEVGKPTKLIYVSTEEHGLVRPVRGRQEILLSEEFIIAPESTPQETKLPVSVAIPKVTPLENTKAATPVLIPVAPPLNVPMAPAPVLNPVPLPLKEAKPPAPILIPVPPPLEKAKAPERVRIPEQLPLGEVNIPVTGMITESTPLSSVRVRGTVMKHGVATPIQVNAPETITITGATPVQVKVDENITQIHFTEAEGDFQFQIEKVVPSTERFVGYNISDRNLRKLDLRNAQIISSTLLNINLSEIDLSGIEFTDSKLNYARLNDSNLTNANLSGNTLRNSTFKNANLQGASMNGSDLKGADLSLANLSHAQLNGAKLRKVNFNGAVALGTQMNHSELSGADFSNVNLQGAGFAASDLSNVNFEGANLRGVNLNKANLRGIKNFELITDIEHANIYGVKNIPQGFKEWALEHGAVEVRTDAGGGTITFGMKNKFPYFFGDIQRNTPDPNTVEARAITEWEGLRNAPKPSE